MKKKFRDIEVDGIKYAWRLRYGSTVVIFKDKKVIFKDRVNTFPITPKTIEIIIRTIILSETFKSLSDEVAMQLLADCPYNESGWCNTDYPCRFKIVGIDKDNGCELSL